MHNATAITTGSANQRPNTPCIRLWTDVTFRGLEDSYCYTPGVRIRVGVRMQNDRANVKVLESKSFCIFSCILTLLIILIKPLRSKAYDRRASGDCGTSGYFILVCFDFVFTCFIAISCRLSDLVYSPFVSYRTRFSQVCSYIIQFRLYNT